MARTLSEELMIFGTKAFYAEQDRISDDPIIGLANYENFKSAETLCLLVAVAKMIESYDSSLREKLKAAGVSLDHL